MHSGERRARTRPGNGEYRGPLEIPRRQWRCPWTCLDIEIVPGRFYVRVERTETRVDVDGDEPAIRHDCVLEVALRETVFPLVRPIANDEDGAAELGGDLRFGDGAAGRQLIAGIERVVQ